ncbi:MFS transporter [Pelagibacterium limicola]|uniref:MFS transporter n=1 Tax=Pelagibacterium limicola TaxID=2791022 RepID=UPI0018AF8F82|nr:MFS transporter [Pelagibacterium limicola]
MFRWASGAVPGYRALLILQALSAFNHNQLRSALLTLVAFREMDRYGMSAETVVALSTLLIVSPFATLSIFGGRMADKWPKASVIQAIKATEIPVFLIAGVALISMNVPLLLLSILLAGVEAALLGPAKFGVLPELLPADDLVAANASMSATNTMAILLGLIAGNLLILLDGGLYIVAIGGVTIGVAGWVASLSLPHTRALMPSLKLHPAHLVLDFWSCFRRLGAVPVVILPVVGCSWFWFQGAVNTTLFPLYVAASPDSAENVVSLLLIASGMGVAVGALGARLLAVRNTSAWLPVAVFAVVFLPGVDLWFAGPMQTSQGVMRAMFDLFLLAIGTGFYVVPLHAALQRLTPHDERARFIGVNHTFNGIAMIAAGFAVLLFGAVEMEIPAMFLLTTGTTGMIAAWTLSATLRALYRNNAVATA